MPQELIDAGENFSLTFSGTAFENHEIPAAALAQSLLALDNLAKTCAYTVYGRSSEIDVKVHGAPRPGSFIIDLIITHSSELTAVGSAVTVLTGVIGLAKWAYGKSVRVIEDLGDKVRVENEIHDIGEFEKTALRLWGMSRTRIDLSRFTQTLDNAGAESIALSDASGTAEVITRNDRRFFRQDDALVLTDNESQLVLEITGPRMNGAPDNWLFSEGEDGAEFKARVEDEEFLQKVRDGEYSFRSGTSIMAVVRTLQIRRARTVTHRSIIQVLDVYAT